MNISWGSVPDAFDAVIDNINAHGGINGRKIVPYLVAVDPTGTAPAATACTQLTEDDTIFVAIAPLMPTCYLQHDTPVVASIDPAGNFFERGSGLHAHTTAVRLRPPAARRLREARRLQAQEGGPVRRRRGGPVGAQPPCSRRWPSSTSRSSRPQLTLHRRATSPPRTPQITSIAQRFQSDGVDEVVAVGDGSAVWPEGLSSIQSSYNPPWVATNESDFTGAVGGAYSAAFLTNVVTSSPLTPPTDIWDNAGTQQCVHTVKKAYPSDQIRAYGASVPESDATWMSVELACTDMALFTDIAKAAGKNLTVSSFVHAGYGLKNLVLPGTNAPVSFGPGRPYALGSVYMVHYDAAAKGVVYADKSTSG